MDKMKEQDDLMKRTMTECLSLASNIESTEYRLRNIHDARISSLE